MRTVMWEARAAPGRLDELVGYVNDSAPAQAMVFRSDDRDPRVVVIDPSGQGMPEVPDTLLARRPHAWSFQPVPRRPSANRPE